MPETLNAGWKDVITKMESITIKGAFATCERTPTTSGKPNRSAEGTYIEALARSKWKINDLQMIQSTGNPIRVEEIPILRNQIS